MKTISVAQATTFDQSAQAKLGIPAILLMENAGRSVAEEALKILGRKKRVMIVCGVGNNGGDGFVAARHLFNAGKKVLVLIIGDLKKLKTDPAVNLNILKKLPIEVVSLEPGLLASSSLIIDAIFGIGLNSPVREPYYSMIGSINKAGKSILSVDVPSGLNADTGRPLGIAVKPTVTVTFVAAKQGMTKKNSGRIVVRDIGVIR